MAHFDTQVWPTCKGLLMFISAIGARSLEEFVSPLIGCD
jgi:hypothetical protein